MPFFSKLKNLGENDIKTSNVNFEIQLSSVKINCRLIKLFNVARLLLQNASLRTVEMENALMTICNNTSFLCPFLSGLSTESMMLEGYGYWNEALHAFKGHNLVSLYKPRHCVVCQASKRKTKSGWGVKTRQKCCLCDVPLCSYRTDRNCFYQFHVDQVEKGRIEKKDHLIKEETTKQDQEN